MEVGSKYDFADRPLQTTRPDGGWTQNAYWDNALYQTTKRKIDTVSGQDQIAFSFSTTDGAGRALRKGSDHPNAIAGKYAGQKFVYAITGYQSDVSNVTAMDADWNAIDEDAATGWLFRNFVYDAQGRPKMITNTDSTTISYDYLGCGCAGGTETTQTDERGCLVRTDTDFMGRLSKSSEMTDASSAYSTVVYTYDALDRMTQIDVKAGETGPATQTRAFVYDDYGRLQSETTPEAGTVSYTYKPNDQVDTKTDARGKVATHTYNTRTLLTGISYNDGGATPAVSFGYDEYGARSSMTDGEGTTNWYYNSFRQIDHETRSFTALSGKYYRLSYTYNLANQPKQVSYVATTTAGMNAAPDNGTRIAALTATGESADSEGLLPGSARGTRADLSNQEFGQKSARGTRALPGWLVLPEWRYSAKDTLFGYALERLFDYSLNLNSARSQGGFTISGTVRRDQSYGGQPIAGVTVTAQRTAGSSGPAQVQVQTNASGAYSISGLPLGTTYQISASKAGWSLSPVAQSYYMFTDVTQNFTGVPSSPTTTISGTVSSSQGGGVSGATMTLSGSMSQTTTTDASGNYSFTVNTLGNYTVTPSKSGWLFNNPSSASTTDDVVLAVTMSFGGSPVTPPPAPPAGAQTWTKNINYVYNSVGSLLSVGTNLIGTDPNANTNVASGMSYTAYGWTKSASYSNGRRLTMSFSASRHQLLSTVVDNQNGTDPIINRSYEYRTWNSELGQWNLDNDGRIKKITDNVDGNYTTTYSYDQFNRLTKANATGYYREYYYDAWGNLTTEYTTNPFNGVNYTAYGFASNASGAPATNRLSTATNVINYAVAGTTSFGYDAAGNLTQDGAIAYSYDAASRLKEVGTGGQNVYGYDGDGLRVKAVSNGGAPIYYVKSSVLGQVAMEIEGSQAVLNRAYVYANGKLLAEQSADGQFYWTHNDHLGSTRRLTNMSGVVVYRAEFDPFGQAVLETGSVSLNSHKFTGYERDWATGLDYASARMFASLRGRFLQSDPVSYGCGNKKPDIMTGARQHKPQSLNRYGYVRNDPVNLIDRTGQDAENPDEIPGFCPAEYSTEECRARGLLAGETNAGYTVGGGWGPILPPIVIPTVDTIAAVPFSLVIGPYWGGNAWYCHYKACDKNPCYDVHTHLAGRGPSCPPGIVVTYARIKYLFIRLCERITEQPIAYRPC